MFIHLVCPVIIIVLLICYGDVRLSSTISSAFPVAFYILLAEFLPHQYYFAISATTNCWLNSLDIFFANYYNSAQNYNSNKMVKTN